MGGIYIHIPFCLKKCYYCDFYSIPVGDMPEFDTCKTCHNENTEDLRARYTRALLAEIYFYGRKYGRNYGKTASPASLAVCQKPFAVDSVFFGGGTPSLMEPKHIVCIIDALKQNFTVSDDAEISMECNPKTLNADNLAGFKAAGVNRLSIGVQSFDDEILEGLGRVHRAGDAAETIKLARQAGFDNINIDLMFAVPRQNMDKWMSTVETALSLKPEHISFYSLEIAEGTPFDKMLSRGEFEETPVELDREMYAEAMDKLAEAGYEHYEISNASLPGRECRHNQKYWHCEDYLGLGPSAHSFMKGVRMYNVSDLNEYMEVLADCEKTEISADGKSVMDFPQCVEACHVNDFNDNVSEYVFTALRTREGVDLEKFRQVAGEGFWTVFRNEKDEFDKYVEEGYAVSDQMHIALTKKGIDISNKIMAIFV